MQLTHNTIAVLRNFSRINTGVLFERGHMLRTIYAQKTMYAEAVLDGECPVDACLLSLKDFLSLIARSDKSLELIFDPTPSGDFPWGCGTILEVETQNRIGSVGFWDPSFINTPPHNKLACEKHLSFELTAADLSYLTKCPDKYKSQILVRFIGDAVRLQKIVHSSVLASIEVCNGVSDAAPFQGTIKNEHLKRLMPGPYTVHVDRKGIGHFQYHGFPLEYWVEVKTHSE